MADRGRALAHKRAREGQDSFSARGLARPRIHCPGRVRVASESRREGPGQRPVGERFKPTALPGYSPRRRSLGIRLREVC